MNGAHKQSIEDQKKRNSALAVPLYAINAVIGSEYLLLPQKIYAG